MSKKEDEKIAQAPKEEPKKEEIQSFWTTLPGIITAIAGLVIAITGLVTALGENGVLNRNGAIPTPFATATQVDQDVILSTPMEATPEPTNAISTAPTCQNFTEYTGKSNPNAILLAYTDTEFWVRYAEIEEEIENIPDVTINIFDTSAASGDCLRRWVKYLVDDHTANWPLGTSSKGRAVNEVWLSAPTPPFVGELSSWSALPDNLLVAAVDDNMLPNFVQVYLCGEDVPREILSNVAYWHAGTSEDALSDYLDQYQSNGYQLRLTVPCGGN
ncbi:hypothetical protein KQH54_00900 [bacterium]|nr:hypothetical protein [bacterium]